MQYHTAELYLCQIGLIESSPQNSAAWSPWRIELLCFGLIAAKSLLGFFLSLPLRYEMSFNNTEWVQLSFALNVAAKLSLIANEAEKAGYQQTIQLRKYLGISDVLRSLIMRIGTLISQAKDDNGDRDVFYHFEQRAKRLQEWYEAQFAFEVNETLDRRNANNEGYASLDNGAQGFPPMGGVHQTVGPYPQSAASSQMSIPNSGYASKYSRMPNSSVPNGAFDFRLTNDFPNANIDDMIGSWMTYPTDVA